ncbi:outer membrane beta-barrel protein [Agrobacterium sp. ES01]|uniref:outer membrane beta-barrel protein n=1 Tax=Agrobacterium sp. ES01 TaxID=3420714 RepID=UPI003D09A534
MKQFLPVIALGCGLSLLGEAANAEDLGWFTDINAGAAFISGDSDTTTGGRDGDGIVSKVKFDDEFVVGGRIGYRFSDPLAVFISYDYLGSNVSWAGTFPGGPAYFDGRAISNIVLANVSYGYNITENTRLNATAGAGVAINQLNDIDEASFKGATPYANLDDGTHTSFAGRAGLELQHNVTESLSLNLGANISYLGSYESGNGRDRSGLYEPINAYELSPIWAATITAGIRLKF